MNNPSLSSEFVMTPHGPMPKSHVIQITPDQIAYVAGDGRVVVEEKASGRIVSEYGNPPVAGALESETSAHVSVPQERFGVSPDSKGGVGGHMGYYAHADNIWTIKEFRTTWTVPDYPRLPSAWESYCLWNGLEGGRLQCVLIWGNGQSRYRIQNRAWLFGGPDGTTQYSVVGEEVPVKAGDPLTGVITLDDSFQGYTYSMLFKQYPETKLTVVRSSEAMQVVECFEPYTDDVDFITRSKKVEMKDIHIEWGMSEGEPSQLEWRVSGVPVPMAKGDDYNTVVVSDSASNGKIDFYFDWKRR